MYVGSRNQLYCASTNTKHGASALGFCSSENEGRPRPPDCRSGIPPACRAMQASHVRMRMIGRSSFSAMDRSRDRRSHSTWNHALPCHAPAPHVPEALVARSTRGRRHGRARKATPFQPGRNSCHHARSEQFRQMGITEFGGR